MIKIDVKKIAPLFWHFYTSLLATRCHLGSLTSHSSICPYSHKLRWISMSNWHVVSEDGDVWLCSECIIINRWLIWIKYSAAWKEQIYRFVNKMVYFLAMSSQYCNYSWTKKHPRHWDMSAQLRFNLMSSWTGSGNFVPEPPAFCEY